uniref:Uncharacterized protein n=1 Tax=Naja naja TaxID=35670 RepID=A0A8C6X4X7_NAJNA
MTLCHILFLSRFLMTNMFYTSSSKNWFTLDFVHILQDNRDAEDEPAKFNVSTIYGPAEYSFHCPLVGTESHYDVLLIPDNDKAKNWKIDISDFQIQAFNIENNIFSYASDCTSFFTPGIWMGLVTSLILLLILTYGIHMILNLTTNSRFDDPKGKSEIIHSCIQLLKRSVSRVSFINGIFKNLLCRYLRNDLNKVLLRKCTLRLKIHPKHILTEK